MKKIGSLSLLLVLLFLKSHSQVGFGIKGGVNLARAKEVGSNGNKYRFAFNAGVLVPVSISEKFSFQPELLYSVKGFKGLPNLFANSSTTSLNYIAIPLLVAFHASDKFAVLAGPEIGFLTNAKVKADNVSYEMEEYYESIDISADLGIRYFFMHGIGVELRYSHGLKDIVNKEQYDNTGQQIANYHLHGNRVFQFNLVYMLAGKR